MRIIAGTRRGRLLNAPKGLTTRPTGNRLRQALFDILSHNSFTNQLQNQFFRQEMMVLDGFAGSGALGLEALSRGAGFCSFIEQAKVAKATLATNIKACGFEEISEILPWDMTALPIAHKAYSLIFLDPPYQTSLLQKSLKALLDNNFAAPDALFALEYEATLPLDLPPLVGLTPVAERIHGRGKILILHYNP